MIKILFTTKSVDAPSTILNANLLKGMNQFDGVKVDFFNSRYADYDVVLFMGYDPDITGARKANKRIKIGIIDPRPTFNMQPVSADFILANGIEMSDWYARVAKRTIIYYIYPELNMQVDKIHKASDKIVIGYHGNKIHLGIMSKRINSALERLAEDYDIELLVMYNIKKLGRWTKNTPNIPITHIQWSMENYYDQLAKVDIGIVPNNIPVTKFDFFFANLFNFSHNRSRTDYFLRFKATSNPGRIFVFAQMGIPVVADMFPSALQIIQDGVNGRVCYSDNSWYKAIKELTYSPELRIKYADKMRTLFTERVSPEVQNRNLLNFLKKF